MQAAETATEVDEAAEDAEATLEESREILKWVFEGAEYRYRKHPDQLALLAPLTLGSDPGEDEVRLATVIRVLPTLTPPFIWLPDDGLTQAALVKQHKAQVSAVKVAATESSGKSALAELRKARPASKALWTEPGGLDAWVLAHVPADLQYAFGRERRQRPRAAKGEPTSTTTAAPAVK